MEEMYLVIVEADTNDGDYIHSIFKTTKERAEECKNIFTKIKESVISTSDYHTPPEEMYKAVLTDLEFDVLEDCLPYGECGIHTIESVSIYKVSEGGEEIYVDKRWNNI